MRDILYFKVFVERIILCQHGSYNLSDDTEVLSKFINEFINDCYRLHCQSDYQYCDPASQHFWGEYGAVMWVVNGRTVFNFVNLCIRIGYLNPAASYTLYLMDQDGLL